MAISPLDRLLIYQIKLIDFDQDLCDEAHQELTQLSYAVSYKSLYGEERKERFAGW